MPALRDYAINYNAVTTQSGFPIATPNYEANDLLVALCSTDTGTQVYTAGENVVEAWTAYTGGTVFTNVTTAANNDTAGDLSAANTAYAANDALYIGHTNKFTSASVLVSTVGTGGPAVFAFEYYNGAAWATPTSIATNITWTVALGYRTNIFVVPTDWATNVPGSTMTNQYWVRIRIASGSFTVRQLFTRAFVGFWQQLFSATNTVNHGILYKIATASEPVEYFMIHSVSETSNGMVMSFRDIDTGTPFSTTSPAAANYSETLRDSDQALGNGTTTGVSQSYTAAAGILTNVRFDLKKVGSPTGTAVAKLYTHSGTFGSSSVPTGVALATSNTYDVSLLTTSYQLITFAFPWKYTQTATNYCLAIEYSGGNASNYVHVGFDTASGAGHAGNKATFASATWTASANDDVCFSAAQFTYTTATAAAMKSFMPTMTTSRDNTLLLYSIANERALVPSIIEGPCTLITGKDGSTHSDGASWGFQATAGVTPGTVGQSNMGIATYTTSTSVIGINPPETGATVIPGYCAADASIYLTPISGVTAFNGDTAFAATATTYFGTTLNGKTLTNGTAAAIADYGLNSYHSMGRLTGVVTSGTWAGATNLFAAAKTTIGGKNILCHMVVNTPVEIQTTDSVSLLGACGVAFGLCTTANTNYKVWHVGGAGTTWDVNRTPIVINTGNTTGIIQTTGSAFNPDSILVLGFAVSGKVAAPDWDFGSAWALDTVTICGGNSTEPLDIPQIVKTSATGHERMSSVQQGAKQMLLLGPLQIGDGGTHPVYLDLDSTAVEFPRQYDKDRKEVYYCSTDNIAGITYYAGSADTISHRNSIISSPSRYHWKLHTSSYINVSSTDRARSTNVATINTSAVHGLSAGNKVLVTGVGGTGYNGVFTVVSAPTTTRITYASTGSDETQTADTAGIIGPKYDFSGLSVIGAGTISLARTLTISELSINDYSTLDVSGATLRYCIITNVPATSASITTSTATLITYSTINVTRVTAANYWVTVGSPVIFTYNTFTGSATTGHAIRITSPGTYDLIGNTFTGFGANTTTSAAILNESGGLVTLNISGGGSTPTYRNISTATTVVNANVSVTIHVQDSSQVAIQNARVYVTRNSDTAVIINAVLTDVNGDATGSTSSGSGAITIRVRKSSIGSTKYQPVETSGTVGSTALTVTVILPLDTVAAAS